MASNLSVQRITSSLSVGTATWRRAYDSLRDRYNRLTKPLADFGGGEKEARNGRACTSTGNYNDGHRGISLRGLFARKKGAKDAHLDAGRHNRHGDILRKECKQLNVAAPAIPPDLCVSNLRNGAGYEYINPLAT